MESDTLRQRHPAKDLKAVAEEVEVEVEADDKDKIEDGHPAGKVKHKGFVEYLRLFLVVIYFLACTIRYLKFMYLICLF